MIHSRILILVILIAFLIACQTENSQTNIVDVPTSTPEPIPTITSTPEPQYQLVWQDEFDGTTLDESKWNIEVHGRPANNELQYYSDSPDNVFIENGNLILQA